MAGLAQPLARDRLFEDDYVPAAVETASFAMGCFWGPDGLFGVLPGVIRTRVGYAGGTHEAPSYHNLGNHAETVEIDYDPSQIRYGCLLDVFWRNHDGFAKPYSGQYRSIIFYRNAAQRDEACALLTHAESERGIRPVTVLSHADTFTRAEAYHQKYRLQSAFSLRPLVAELLDRYGDFDGFVNSTVSARLNGFVAGWASRDQLVPALHRYGLSEPAKEDLLKTIRS